MTLLTLPPWIREGQAVQSAYPDVMFEIRHTPGVWTIRGIRNMNTLSDSMVRIERKYNNDYISTWIGLHDFLCDWRPVTETTP